MLNPAQTGEWEEITNTITWNTSYIETALTDMKLYKNNYGMLKAQGGFRLKTAINSEVTIATLGDTTLQQVIPVYKNNALISAIIAGGTFLVIPYNSSTAPIGYYSV